MVSLMFQSQREDSHIPAACRWHLHQPALYGRPPNQLKLMWSPDAIRNRFVRQEQTKRTNNMGSHLIQRSFITFSLLHFSGRGDIWFTHLTSSKLSPVTDLVSWIHFACGFSPHGPIRCHILTMSRGVCIWYVSPELKGCNMWYGNCDCI